MSNYHQLVYQSNFLLPSLIETLPTLGLRGQTESLCPYQSTNCRLFQILKSHVVFFVTSKPISTYTYAIVNNPAIYKSLLM